MISFIKRLLLKLIGGSRNDRLIRARMKIVREQINPLEAGLAGLSDDELRQRSTELRQRRQGGESRQKILPEAFALIREASKRGRAHRQFDVQLVAGMVLDEGWIAEEATGEGKTVACYPAIYMAWLDGLKVHVVTTNDYLVKRDAEFAQPIFELLGVTVGYVLESMPSYGPEVAVRKEAYGCDVTYATNSELGFDYLRDNMKLSTADQVQGQLGMAIIDEVDNILIDEARTPLIISGPAYGDISVYRKADGVARELIRRNRDWDQASRRVESIERTIKALQGERDKASGKESTELEAQLETASGDLAEAQSQRDEAVQYFEVEIEHKRVHMTHEGVTAAQDIAGVGSFYVGANMDWPHRMEQSLRAHLTFERDKDYIVQDGKVVIVDEFTGRLMEGRQWSDGLHQAVEAKEQVQVKEETQTIATITFQNFFNLYEKLAGMTGTAMTEATELMKIYGLDVAAISTHRPINRVDHEDVIFSEVEPKYRAIVEEVNAVARKGRPVLVGTTSIEKSELISTMLQRTYGLDHEVLNGRRENAARESDIVLKAGHQHPLKQGSKEVVGNVTIATNMAGRGTDIKLGPGVVCPSCQVPPAEKLAELGVAPDPLFPSGVNKCCIHCQQYDAATNCAHCFKPKLDASFPARGRSECTAEVPCGLHIVGTERHESRRIDNQLRGRAGRQGDPGSSRFFLSLRDELMAVFAGEWTIKVLGWLGLSGDAAIQDKRISKGVERAQRKVEERNFEIRKNLLEYDEIMDHQRKTFYAMRQDILEGRNLAGMVREMIDESIDGAVEDYLRGNYAARCIAEWARSQLQVAAEAEDFRSTDPDDQPAIEKQLRDSARDEARATIAMTLGEYMDPDIDARQWDIKGLSGWAKSRFDVTISQNQLRKMDPPQVEEELCQAASARIDEADLSGLVTLLEPNYALSCFAEWARQKFDISVTLEELTDDPDTARQVLAEKVAEAYRRRQITYPPEHLIERTIGQAGTDNVYACDALAQWANRKYDAGWTGADNVQGRKVAEVYRDLVALAEQWWQGGKLESAVDDALGSDPTAEAAAAFVKDRFETLATPEDITVRGIRDTVVSIGRQFLRREMTELERFVLLQIFDGSWKDHLLNMDHLKGSINLRGYAEQDPKVAYKRDGGRLFDELFGSIREKVTDMIFKVRLSPEAQMESVYEVSDQSHEDFGGYEQLAGQAGPGDAQQAMDAQQTVETIVREEPKVGRNDPCPCGSGKKYKKCCGAND
jgi:preprotein translocase subunit SecA